MSYRHLGHHPKFESEVPYARLEQNLIFQPPPLILIFQIHFERRLEQMYGLFAIRVPVEVLSRFGGLQEAGADHVFLVFAPQVEVNPHYHTVEGARAGSGGVTL